jgi:hypothetical protein
MSDNFRICTGDDLRPGSGRPSLPYQAVLGRRHMRPESKGKLPSDIGIDDFDVEHLEHAHAVHMLEADGSCCLISAVSGSASVWFGRDFRLEWRTKADGDSLYSRTMSCARSVHNRTASREEDREEKER